jgi:hypothetical protein
MIKSKAASLSRFPAVVAFLVLLLVARTELWDTVYPALLQ